MSEDRMPKPQFITLCDEAVERFGDWRQDAHRCDEGLTRLTVRATDEWRPLARISDAERVARLVARCDGVLGEFCDHPLGAQHLPIMWAKQAIKEAISAGDLLWSDPETAEMLSAFDFKNT